MKRFVISLLLFFWFIFTIISALSIIGIILLDSCYDSNGESIWFGIGNDLKNELLK